MSRSSWRKQLRAGIGMIKGCAEAAVFGTALSLEGEAAARKRDFCLGAGLVREFWENLEKMGGNV